MSTIVPSRSRKTRSSTKSEPSAANTTDRPPTSAKVAAPPPAVAVDDRIALLLDLHRTRADGGACFGESGSPSVKKTWASLEARVAAANDAECRTTAKVAKQRSGRPAAEFKGLPKPASSFHHEGLQASVLRTDWSSSAAQLAVDWSTSELRCEFSVGRDVLFSGPLPVQATVDGRPRRAIGTWEEVLWESDENVDYLELEIALEGDVRLQRHFALTRRDGLLVIADALLPSRPGRLECELRLPTAAGVRFVPEAETRDGLLVAGKRRAAVLPLALPEWRCERRVGELTATDDLLVLSQATERGAAMFAPLAIVFDSARARRERTWRQLTVGENLQLQPTDRAAGFRLQTAREHWILYRSLTGRANRTVFGVNLQTNFLLGRFKADGEVETLIEVED